MVLAKSNHGRAHSTWVCTSRKRRERSRDENVLFDRDAGFTASYMETLVMTESGIEVLSTRPRTLTVLAG